MDFDHIPVLPREVIENLKIDPDGIYVDGTLGGAGHSSEIAKRLNGGRLIGIDQDEDALKAAGVRLKEYAYKVTLVHDNYINIPEVLKRIGIKEVDGILLDIGVSSYQIDDPERGFSYRYDSPLDMRMDRNAALSAKDVVNRYSEEELARIIKTYGEENFAKQIAKHIVKSREKEPIETTGRLKEIIRQSIPPSIRKGGEGYAKKTFQAIRIEVNSELNVLEKSIEPLVELLKPEGRLLIITFHSLEDRIVKESFRRMENPCTCPPSFPVCVCGKKPLGRIITKHPIIADEEEVKANKRASSAKLRIFEKL